MNDSMNKLTPIFIAGSFAISAGLALAQSQMNKDDPMQSHNMPEMNMSGTERPISDDLSTKAYIAANDSMHEDMMVEFTGAPDIDLMRGMIPHHQDAIDMANIVLEHGKELEVRKLSEEVIKAQEGEIAKMKKRIADRGQ